LKNFFVSSAIIVLLRRITQYELDCPQDIHNKTRTYFFSVQIGVKMISFEVRKSDVKKSGKKI